ncbi:hypothetical protein [Nitrosomonas ureae]|uniref:PRTase-CE domain-containing protein n=1 Tax=Nitrosomonas ureae TaxID=44577 RepID=A0A1H2HNA8_9PROT|nr:hypothetical protein [Nitrosomonas ureae]SDU33219.1 hypothetical protein SAMN05216406_1568 [Nitrosomonas ureae]
MSFKIPDGWESYHREIKNCFESLIHANVIQGLRLLSLNAWYSNFKTAEEKYLAAHLLDSLVYRTEPMLNSSCKQLVSKILPQVLRKLEYPIYDIEQFTKSLQQENLPIVFTPVKCDTPGKSGETLIRIFKRVNDIHNSKLIHPEAIENLPENIKFVVIIDDMVGTGMQFKNFYTKYKFANHSKGKLLKIIYIPLMAHQKGIEKLKSECPELKLFPIEVLSQQHNFFRSKDTESNIWFKDKVNTVEDVQLFYKELLQKYSINSKNPFGHGQLGLTVFTSFSSPNNSLNIFYTRKHPDWAPLLKR